MHTILVIDDTPENLAVLHDALDEAGYIVLVATSGEIAFNIIKHNIPDLILLDAMMPVMNGFDVALEIKKNPLTSTLPIIFMTGLTETENIVKAFNSGVVDYITKPIKPEEVLVRIAAHLKISKENTQIRDLLDQVDLATISINTKSNTVNWLSKRTGVLLERYCDLVEVNWANQLLALLKGFNLSKDNMDAPFIIGQKDGARLFCQIRSFYDQSHELILTLREENETLAIELLQKEFDITLKESEVLYWLVKGKTNKEISIILGSSHRTVDKHVEHLFDKIQAENRNAIINIVMSNKNVRYLLTQY
ncbi:MAG: DNA-binding response regulator [Ferrovum sp. 37-45-19]|jgi:DNA-binding response OmpR family regulator/DNA-binding CsgD family transcriptional regulator|uniref:response regulator n=1 Tax=Ferrovum sp. JA12 TaxID=1356299 RepID=UPI0007024BB3|nr:response regulator [Ferrovum sp. JA12]OYV79920.1 MAG: DNA-binding response regulator [Ferrovum sp. 21-44-67]OYV95545.1 MAG: DNA-binding response regulator [Ferrovum sp. 37-45-19]OZB31585.1 MAG: DNA-binding response regulator [Ferrovum sp. 34-44-207]HQT81895.1 response regulator [Ferrovaceae bacterium]KRH78233.1 transcriptional activator protein CzcR [Ferrovum sp. JA12]